AFQLRIADTSRLALTAGTQIPVVRDSELLTGTARLLAIPADPRFRLTFRLYELDLTASEFAVRVYEQGTGTLLDERVLTLAAPHPERIPRFEPAYAEIPDFGSLAASGRLQVEIEPLTEGAKFWAFVSITNNETQQITLVTPE
ncbi:MAG TPA: hypothetical protein VEU30_07825, partial [Thermoanaerobaculia bacterium]|nr:hypothetical protein [Thermoanaerobaculia bacterium]